MKEEEYVVFDARESVWESVLRDVLTFSLLALCVYASRDSTFWTFVTGVMFILFVFAKARYVVVRRTKIFHSVAELQEWVDSL